MNEENFFKSNLVETIGIIVFMFLYALLGIYYFPLNLVLFPVAFIFLGVRRGMFQSFISILAVCVLVGITVDIMSGAMLFILFMPITSIIIYGIKLRKKPSEILILSTAIFFISMLTFYGYAQRITGVSIVSQMEESFKQMLNIQVDMFREMGLSNYEVLKSKDLLESGYKYILWIFPTILILISMIINFCSYYISVLALRRSGLGIVYIPRFSKFKLPNNIVPGIIVMFLGAYLGKTLGMQYYDTIVLNVSVLIGVMFLIQGFSVIDFLLLKLGTKLVFRIILLLTLIIIAPLGTLVSLIGFSDILFDFRKLKKQKS